VRWLDVQMPGETASVLLHLAVLTHYATTLLEDTRRSGSRLVAAVVDEVFGSCAKPMNASLRDALAEAGMPRDRRRLFERTNFASAVG